MRASASSGSPGGFSVGSGPAGEPTSVRRPRAANCGCRHTSAMVFSRALAICAASSRSITCAAVKAAKFSTISARSEARFALRCALLAKRGSPASAGRCSTCAQNGSHSRSFCRPSITVCPSPAGNGP
jgi:hypothetical protein